MGAATKVGVVGPGEAARRPGTILCDGTRADGDTMDTPPTQIPIDLARAEPQQIETDPVLESPLEWTLRWVGGGWCRRRRRRSGDEDEVVPAASEAERSGGGGVGGPGRRGG